MNKISPGLQAVAAFHSIPFEQKCTRQKRRNNSCAAICSALRPTRIMATLCAPSSSRLAASSFPRASMKFHSLGNDSQAPETDLEVRSVNPWLNL
jgi:hypothetical protein